MSLAFRRYRPPTCGSRSFAMPCSQPPLCATPTQTAFCGDGPTIVPNPSKTMPQQQDDEREACLQHLCESVRDLERTAASPLAPAAKLELLLAHIGAAVHW